ncbi:LysR substrate-binding domain-containing protein [Leucothrix mucor]|uniref:LysR substrate-binding domain-containing protein n=1 Tax=Leucothrix mucor TaxID=45248 RepID=UPI0003B5A79D|nr:LysR substrate-binding domain-containing protein [Leucothrix mucor]
MSVRYKNLSIDLLRTFTTVTELASMSRAGELLGRSQPAISLQIQRLETLVNEHLFKRTAGQRFELTVSGQVLFDYAQRILMLNDEAMNYFAAPTMRDSIHLGIPNEFASTLLPRIIGRFAQIYPGVRLEVTCDLSNVLMPQFMAKKFDLLLVLSDNTIPATQHTSFVKVDSLVWVTNKNKESHLRSTIPLVVAPEGCLYRRRMLQRLSRISQPWNIVYTIPGLTGIQAAIAEGLGVTALAKSTVPPSLDIVRESERFPELGDISISLLRQADSTGEAIDVLAEYIKTSLA